MVVVYALPVEVMEDSVPNSFRDAKLSSESDLWRKTMVEELSPFMSTTLGKLLSYPKGRKPLDANEFF